MNALTMPAEDQTTGQEAGSRGRRRRAPWIALVIAGLALQTVTSRYLAITGDERGVAAVAGAFLRHGSRSPNAPGTDWVSHSPAGILVHIVFGAARWLGPPGRGGRVLMFLLMCCGVLLLAISLSHAVSERSAFWFVASYWLSPWVMYHGLQAWEPGIAMECGAAALAASLILSKRKDAVASGALFLAIMVAFQMHGQFAILVLSTAILAIRRRIRIHPLGAVVGILIGSITILPPVSSRPFTPVQNVSSSEHPDARPFFGLSQGYPLLRAVGFWVRASSPEMNRQMRENRFFGPLRANASLPERIRFGAVAGIIVLSLAAVIASFVANWWFFTRPLDAANEPQQAWLKAYAGASFLSVLIAAAASPVCIQGWYVAIALPAAALPFGAWCERMWERGPASARALVAGLFVLRALSIILIALGYQP